MTFSAVKNCKQVTFRVPEGVEEEIFKVAFKSWETENVTNTSLGKLATLHVYCRRIANILLQCKLAILIFEPIDSPQTCRMLCCDRAFDEDATSFIGR